MGKPNTNTLTSVFLLYVIQRECLNPLFKFPSIGREGLAMGESSPKLHFPTHNR